MLVSRIGVLLFSSWVLGVMGTAIIAQEPQSKEEPEIKKEASQSKNQSQNEIPYTPPPKNGNLPEVPESARVKLDKEHPWFRDVISEGPLPVEKAGEPPSNESKAYDYVLAHASKIDPALLKKYAVAGVPFQDLILENTRGDYQRELLHYEGRLVRLRRFKAPAGLGLDKIEWLYEAWILPKSNQRQDPIFFVLTCVEAPEGLEPSEEYKKPIWVSFDAYYFKVLTYPTAEKKPDGKPQWRRSPLFLGRNFTINPPPEKSGDGGEWAAGFALAAITIALVCAAVFTMIHRRGDRKVKSEFYRRLDLVTDFENENRPQAEDKNKNRENPNS